MPIHRRLPKRGFNNIFRTEYQIVNLADIMKTDKIDKGNIINLDSLIRSGLVRNKKLPVKILGNGNLDIPLTIEARKFSASAEKKIIDAGGKTIILDK